MLPKKHRLTKNTDFKRILARGRSFFSPAFRIKYLTNGLGALRTAIVVSAKVSKKATIRNRLKRQIGEIIRLNLEKIYSGYDLLIYLNSNALTKNYQQLAEELLLNLKKLKLLK